MKIKLYHKIMKALASRTWLKGVLGNMVSTIIGILLTIGIGAMVQYYNEKKLARETMFSIVKICDDNCKLLEEYDSVFQKEITLSRKLVDLYYNTDRLTHFKDKKQ